MLLTYKGRALFVCEFVSILFCKFSTEFFRFSFDVAISSLVGTASGLFTSSENAPTPIIKNKIAKPKEYFTLLYLFAIERKVFSTLYRLLSIFTSPFIQYNKI